MKLYYHLNQYYYRMNLVICMKYIFRLNTCAQKMRECVLEMYQYRHKRSYLHLSTVKITGMYDRYRFHWTSWDLSLYVSAMAVQGVVILRIDINWCSNTSKPIYFQFYDQYIDLHTVLLNHLVIQVLILDIYIIIVIMRWERKFWDERPRMRALWYLVLFKGYVLIRYILQQLWNGLWHRFYRAWCLSVMVYPISFRMLTFLIIYCVNTISIFEQE